MERKSAARVMTKPNIWDRLNGRLTLWSALSCQGLLFRIPRVAVNPVSEWSRLQPSVRRILTRRRNVCLRAPYPRDSVNPPWRDRKGVRALSILFRPVDNHPFLPFFQLGRAMGSWDCAIDRIADHNGTMIFDFLFSLSLFISMRLVNFGTI